MASPDRKADIRRCAAEVFAVSGYDAASIRDVAKATEMSLAGLYYYYKGKDEILFDIQHESFRTLLDRQSEALAGVKDPKEKLRRVVSTHIQFFAGNIPQMKVLSRESEQLTGKYAERVGELRRRYVRLVRGILDELGAGDALKDFSVGTAVFLLFGMMNWLYTWYDPAKDGTPEKLADAVQEIFLSGILKRG